jgi:exodeoxyribonuclease VII large subunit
MAVYTVSQITRYLRDSLERDSLLADLWISGEVFNLRPHSSGRSYLTIKDAQTQLRCVMFRNGKGADLLAEGSLVIAHGRISLFEARGDLQMVADLIMPEGTGPLYLELERMKMRLEEEGLFESSRKRSLPRFPRVVGLVTSPTGAVVHDVRSVMGRRYPLVELLLAPAQVQGNGAGTSIVSAINALNAEGRADVIILARGGGSIEELWAFNEEIVARAVYASRIPIVSAVGHDRDWTVADYVADVRAPTPSAAAELVVPDGVALLHELQGHRAGLSRTFAKLVDSRRMDVEGRARDLTLHAPDLAALAHSIKDLSRSATTAMSGRVSRMKQDVEGGRIGLRALEPRSILGRGYAIVEKRAGSLVVSRKDQVAIGDDLKITVTDGSIEATAGKGARRPRPRRDAPATAGARLF